ncbi:MAG: hypothetical protein GF350_06555 [Chitinivibrionales bacterium]|nr:hypothetical protein [Chitinivibrionales bacterium]
MIIISARLVLPLMVLVSNAIPLRSQEQSFSDEIRQHFEWGEYDKLIKKLEPVLESPPESLDSVTIAACHKYLGVAYFARGRIGDAQGQFEKALMIDPGATLKHDFVSQPMLDLFNSVVDNISERRRQKQEAERKDSLIVTREMELQKSISTLTELQRAEIIRKKKLMTIASAALYSFASLLSGAAVYEYGVAEENYEKYEYANSRGFLRDRRKHERKVLRADILIIVSASAAFVSAISGTFFVRKAVKAKSRLADDQSIRRSNTGLK